MDIRDIRERIDEQDAMFLSVGVVLGIVLGIVAALLLWAPSSDTTGGADHARLSGAQPSGESSSPPAREPDQMRRCLDAATVMRPALRRAVSGVDQWEIHVGAMNKLVVGAITLQQATAFWNQTRVGARHRITAFDRAWTRVRRQGLDCPPSALLPASAPRELRSCAREVAADLRVLDAARSAMDTWSRHVRAMEMLRMGKVSPATATQMWLAMWQRGQQEIVAYRAAVGAAHRGPACAAAPAPSTTPSP